MTSPRVTFASETVEVRRKEDQAPMSAPTEQGKCTCCPYGYHIDLDFLNFCRDVESGSTLRNLKRIQRAKRKLRKSMELMLDEQESHAAEPHSAPPDVVNATEAGRLMNMINYERSATHRILNQIDSSVNTHIAKLESGGVRNMSTDSDEGMTPASPHSPHFQSSHPSADDSQLFNISGRTDSMSSLSSLTSMSSVSSEAPLMHRAYFIQQQQQQQQNHHQHQQFSYQQYQQTQQNHQTQQHNHTQQQPQIQQLQNQIQQHTQNQLQELQDYQYQLNYQQSQRQNHNKKIVTTTTEVIENPVLEMATAEMKYQANPVLEMATAEMKPLPTHSPPAPPVKDESTKQKYTAHLAAQYKVNNGFESSDSNEPPDRLEPPRVSLDINQLELTSVREAMAVSLARMRELEEQVKAIPILQVRISVLKEEKRLLNLQLKASKTSSKPMTRTVGTVTDLTEPPISPRVFTPKEKSPPPTMPKPVRSVSVGIGNHSVVEPYLIRPDLPSGFVLVEHNTHSELHTSTNSHSESTTVIEREINHSRIPSLNVNLQQTERETRSSTSDLNAPHFTINQIQRSAAPKPLTRSIGFGEGNVFEGGSGLHVHEKEFTALFIGQNSNVAKRNVGIECRVPTRDVGVFFQCEDEKPETRTIGVNVNYDTSDIHTTLDFKGETQLRMALRGVLQRNVHSVGVNCNFKPETVECGTVMDVDRSVSVGCGDEENRTDVEIRMPVVRKSVSTGFKPETTVKCVGTEVGWLVEASTNTVQVDKYHKACVTDKPRCSHSASNTDTTQCRDENNQTEIKMFLAMDCLRHSSVNTQKVATSSAGVATDVVPVFDTEVNTTEKVSDIFYKPPQTKNMASNTEVTETRSFSAATDDVPVSHISVNTTEAVSNVFYNPPEKRSAGSNTDVKPVSVTAINTETPATYAIGSNTETPTMSCIGSNTDTTTTTCIGSNTDTTVTTCIGSNTDVKETFTVGLATDVTKVSDMSVNTTGEMHEKPETSSIGSATDVTKVSHIATQEKPESLSVGMITDTTQVSDIAVNTTEPVLKEVQEEIARKSTNNLFAPNMKSLTTVDIGVGDELVNEPSYFSETVKINYPFQKVLPTEEIMLRDESSYSQEEIKTVDTTQLSSYEMSLRRTNTNTDSQQVDSTDSSRFSSYEVTFPSKHEDHSQYSSYEMNFTSKNAQATISSDDFINNSSNTQSDLDTKTKDDNVTFIEEYYIIRDGRKMLVSKELTSPLETPSEAINTVYQYSTDGQKTWSTESDISSSYTLSSNGFSDLNGNNQVMETSESSFVESSCSSNGQTLSQNIKSEEFVEKSNSVQVTNPYKTVGNLSMLSTSPDNESITMRSESSRLMSDSGAITRTKRTNSDGNLYIDPKRFSCPATMQNLETIYDLRRAGSVEDFMPDDIRKYMSIDPSTSKDSGFGEDLLQRFSDKSLNSTTSSSSSLSSDKARSTKVMKISKKVTTRRMTRSGDHTIVQETKTIEGPDGQVSTTFVETDNGNIVRQEGALSDQSLTTEYDGSESYSQHEVSPLSDGDEEGSDRSRYSSLDRKTGELRSILKQRKPSETSEGELPKKGLTFAESVTGGTGSSSEEDDDGEEDPDETDSGTDSETSFEEGSYDSKHGAVVYRCEDDEAIAQGMPGAQMFDQNIRETYELSDEVREACSILATYLVDSTQVQTKELNASQNTIQTEWFQVSSHKLSLPHQVEDFLSSVNEISKRLLEYIVNMTDANGNTAIHYCISHCNFEIAGLLLDSEICDINKANKAGYTPIMLAGLATLQCHQQTQMVKRLFSLGDINARAQATLQTALMLAASHGRLETVQMLCEAGADVNLQDCDGSTALMCACEHGHLDIVNLLLSQASIDASLTDNEGSTALTIAMEAGHKDVGVVLYKHLNFSKAPSPLHPVKYTTIWTVYVSRIFRYIRPPLRKLSAVSFL